MTWITIGYNRAAAERKSRGAYCPRGFGERDAIPRPPRGCERAGGVFAGIFEPVDRTGGDLDAFVFANQADAVVHRDPRRAFDHDPVFGPVA